MVGEACRPDHILAEHPAGAANHQFHAPQHGRRAHRSSSPGFAPYSGHGAPGIALSTLVGAAAVLPVPGGGRRLARPLGHLDDGQHVAVATAGGWAPLVPDVHLQRPQPLDAARPGVPEPAAVGAVNIWAPEITKLSEGRYAVFYSALLEARRDPWFCLGVATASSATGPWRDLGRPMRCGKEGSIDPYRRCATRTAAGPALQGRRQRVPAAHADLGASAERGRDALSGSPR